MSYLTDRVAKAISKNREAEWCARDGHTHDAIGRIVGYLLKMTTYDGSGFEEDICGPGTTLAKVAAGLRYYGFIVSEHDTGPGDCPYIHVSVPKPEGEK